MPDVDDKSSKTLLFLRKVQNCGAFSCQIHEVRVCGWNPQPFLSCSSPRNPVLPCTDSVDLYRAFTVFFETFLWKPSTGVWKLFDSSRPRAALPSAISTSWRSVRRSF
eukprot:symbB.v1.2.028924.t1/scaffold3113.1/size63308/5